MMNRSTSISDVSQAARNALAAAGPTVELADREYLMHDGDRSHTAYLVVEGLLKVVKTSLDGKVSFLGLRGAGSLVGELGVLAPGPRTSSLQAVMPTCLVAISDAAFEQLLADYPDLSRNLLTQLATKLREATSQIHELMSADAMTRMAARLAQLADDTNDTDDTDDTGLTIELPVSQQELGEWAGLSRAGAVNALRDLRDEGFIETSRMAVKILDLRSLRSVAVA